MRTFLRLGLAIFALSALPLRASADDAVDKARDLLLELRFDEARNTAEKALKEGKRSPPEVATLYMVIGEVLASMGQEKDARNQFRNALAVQPDLELPKGASPKLIEPFQAAQALLEGATPLDVSAHIESGKLKISIESDAARLVGAVRVTMKIAGKRRVKRRNILDSVSLKLPDTASDIGVHILDEYGNLLLDVALGEAGDDAQEDEEPAQEKLDPEDGQVSVESAGNERPGLAMRWELWGGVGLVFAGAATYFGVQSSKTAKDVEALPDGTEFSEAQSLEKKAKRQALYANVGFSLAGASVIAAAWLYFRERDSNSERQGPGLTAQIAPLLGTDLAGASATFEF
jgi:hypothetical protein